MAPRQERRSRSGSCGGSPPIQAPTPSRTGGRRRQGARFRLRRGRPHARPTRRPGPAWPHRITEQAPMPTARALAAAASTATSRAGYPRPPAASTTVSAPRTSMIAGTASSLCPGVPAQFAVLWHEPQAVTRVARQLRVDEMPRDAGGVRARRPGTAPGPLPPAASPPRGRGRRSLHEVTRSPRYLAFLPD